MTIATTHEPDPDICSPYCTDADHPVVQVIDTSCSCERCTSRTTAMYDLPGRCLNCGARFMVRSRKGDKPPLSIECPACEVDGYGWRVPA